MAPSGTVAVGTTWIWSAKSRQNQLPASDAERDADQQADGDRDGRLPGDGGRDVAPGEAHALQEGQVAAAASDRHRQHEGQRRRVRPPPGSPATRVGVAPMPSLLTISAGRRDENTSVEPSNSPMPAVSSRSHASASVGVGPLGVADEHGRRAERVVQRPWHQLAARPCRRPRATGGCRGSGPTAGNAAVPDDPRRGRLAPAARAAPRRPRPCRAPRGWRCRRTISSSSATARPVTIGGSTVEPRIDAQERDVAAVDVVGPEVHRRPVVDRGSSSSKARRGLRIDPAVAGGVEQGGVPVPAVEARGVDTGLSRLAAKHSAATSAVMATAVPASTERTGTAVRPVARLERESSAHDRRGAQPCPGRQLDGERRPSHARPGALLCGHGAHHHDPERRRRARAPR